MELRWRMYQQFSSVCCSCPSSSSSSLSVDRRTNQVFYQCSFVQCKLSTSLKIALNLLLLRLYFILLREHWQIDHVCFENERYLHEITEGRRTVNQQREETNSNATWLTRWYGSCCTQNEQLRTKRWRQKRRMSQTWFTTETSWTELIIIANVDDGLGET